MTADRPTGPATAAGQALYDAWITHTDDSWTLDDMESAILAIEAEQKARILAALPEALLESGMSEWSDSIEGESVVFGGTVAELAAALAAAIEKVLG